MSSHHIVREKQEPALLVLGLDDFSEEQLGQLLEWSPTVIASPDTAEKLHSFGIKIDCVATDGHADSLQSDIKVIPMGSQTVMAAALQYLAASGYPSVNIITDEFILGDYANFWDKINLVIFNAGRKIYAVTPGFSKWKLAGETIEILGTFTNLSYTGLKETGIKQFKTTDDGLFSLQFDEPFLFISEEL